MDSRFEPLHVQFSGLVQIQNALIDLDRVTDAFREWSGDPHLSPIDFLAGRGSLDANRVEMMEGLAYLLEQRSASATDSSGSSIKPSTSLPTERGTTERSATEDDHRFRVVRHHDEGGLGTVSVAIDRQLNREVALKQIHARHADDPARRERFLIEAEITGGLEHPGIVPVYSLGHSADGRPFYAMRLIRGETLADAIIRFHQETSPGDPDAWGLELRKLLRRFVDVCDAIEYAHGRGILHRDLKPSNIMIGKHGETLVVDWGLAKPIVAMEPDEGEEGPLLPSSGGSETLPGSAIGTPSFMSPEQAAGRKATIGPRSDVYSLGATLYCLLTGRPPFDSKEQGRILQDVREGNYARPRQIAPRVPRPLEAICLKAMALDPNDRYGSTRELAEDIERWKADQPISAFREPLIGRLGRWSRSRRTTVTAAAASCLVAMAALGLISGLQARANGELRQAYDQTKRINQALLEANRRVARINVELREAGLRERSRFELALEAIRTFHRQVGDDLLLREAEFASLRSRLMNDAITFYRKLEGELEGQLDRSSREATAKIYYQIASLEATLGTAREILVAHRKSLELRRTLAAESPFDRVARSEVASALISLGMMVRNLESQSAGLKHLEEARAILDDLHRLTPDDREFRRLLVQAELEIGLTMGATGRNTEALTAYDKALKLQEILVQEEQTAVGPADTLAALTNQKGVLLIFMGRRPEALATLTTARRILERLIAKDPANVRFQAKLADVLKDIGDLLSWSGRNQEALEVHQRALTIRESLSAALPASAGYRITIAHSLMALGKVHRKMGDKPKAAEAFRRSIALQEGTPDSANGFFNLAHCRVRLAELLEGDEREIEIARAALAFRRAWEQGYRDVSKIRAIAEGSPAIEKHRGFRLFLLDLDFPEKAFGDSPS